MLEFEGAKLNRFFEVFVQMRIFRPLSDLNLFRPNLLTTS